jgi:hypothetical protein
VLRAAGETETTQENIQDWLELPERGPRFGLLVMLWILNKGSTVICLIFFTSITYINKFSIYLFSTFCLLGLFFVPLVRIIG